ncbi:unnamed protein product [Symbiodinium necroappetens]|uniref:C3H1-type domain-containing protein n=1 Tax=Symbiodinium necroappetens TaxID=1628268 RepID=A0A813ADM7_9DINO|nr:unnamed protein product [Symbiodinium necroappetens]
MFGSPDRSRREEARILNPIAQSAEWSNATVQGAMHGDFWDSVGLRPSGWGSGLQQMLAIVLTSCVDGTDGLADPKISVSILLTQHQLDFCPTVTSVTAYARLLQAEMETLALSGADVELEEAPRQTKKQRAAALRKEQTAAAKAGTKGGGDAASSSGPESGAAAQGKGGQGTGKGGSSNSNAGANNAAGGKAPCKFYAMKGGCKMGRSCWSYHDFGKASAEGRCYTCGSTEHKADACSRPQGKRGAKGEDAPRGELGSSSSGAGGAGKGGPKGSVPDSASKGDGKASQVRQVTAEESTTNASSSSGGADPKVARAAEASSQDLIAEATRLLKGFRIAAARVSDTESCGSGLDRPVEDTSSAHEESSPGASEGFYLTKVVKEPPKGARGLLDGGATNSLRTAKSQEEIDQCTLTQVSLALGHAELLLTPVGTLISAEPVAPIVPMGVLAAELDCKVNWEGETCRVIHPKRGKLPIVMVNRCPELCAKITEELIAEIEDKRALVMQRALRLKAIALGVSQQGINEPVSVDAMLEWLQKLSPDCPKGILAWVPPVWQDDLKGEDVPFNRRVRRAVQRADKVVLHLFSGRTKPQDFGQWPSSVYVLSVDLERGLDILSDGLYQYLLELCSSGKVIAVVGGALGHCTAKPTTLLVNVETPPEEEEDDHNSWAALRVTWGMQAGPHSDRNMKDTKNWLVPISRFGGGGDEKAVWFDSRKRHAIEAADGDRIVVVAYTPRLPQPKSPKPVAQIGRDPQYFDISTDSEEDSSEGEWEGTGEPKDFDQRVARLLQLVREEEKALIEELRQGLTNVTPCLVAELQEDLKIANLLQEQDGCEHELELVRSKFALHKLASVERELEQAWCEVEKTSLPQVRAIKVPAESSQEVDHDPSPGLGPACGSVFALGDGLVPWESPPSLHPDFGLETPEIVGKGACAVPGALLQTRIVSQAEVWKNLEQWRQPLTDEVVALKDLHRAVWAIGPEELKRLEELAEVSVIPAKGVYTQKPITNRLRARIVGCGNFLEGEPPAEDAAKGSTRSQDLYAGGVDGVSVRLQTSVAAIKGWGNATLDIKTAFLGAPLYQDRQGQAVLSPGDLSSGRLDFDMLVRKLKSVQGNKVKIVVVTPPRVLVSLGLVEESEKWLVLKALYGLAEAPRRWSSHRDMLLRQHTWEDCGRRFSLKQCVADSNLWKIVSEPLSGGVDVKTESEPVLHGLLGIYVDDMLITAEEPVKER